MTNNNKKKDHQRSVYQCKQSKKQWIKKEDLQYTYKQLCWFHSVWIISNNFIISVKLLRNALGDCTHTQTPQAIPNIVGRFLWFCCLFFRLRWKFVLCRLLYMRRCCDHKMYFWCCFWAFLCMLVSFRDNDRFAKS